MVIDEFGVVVADFRWAESIELKAHLVILLADVIVGKLASMPFY